MFSNRDLRNLIIPLFVEQFLLMLVGIADTFMVSFSSEADVSGVSLVTSFNTVLIFLFTALSSGGAVIISQYIGSKQQNEASRSAGQLLMVSTVISVAMTVPHPVRSGSDGVLLLREKSGALQSGVCVLLGQRAAERDHGYRAAQRSGKRHTPTGEGGAVQHGGTVRPVAGLGRYWRGCGDEHRSGVPRRYFHLAV